MDPTVRRSILLIDDEQDFREVIGKSPVRWTRISASGCGTPASGCADDETALWKFASKPLAARN